MSFTNY